MGEGSKWTDIDTKRRHENKCNYQPQNKNNNFTSLAWGIPVIPIPS